MPSPKDTALRSVTQASQWACRVRGIADAVALSALQRTGKDLRQIGVEPPDDDLQHRHARVVLAAFEPTDDIGVYVGFTRQGFLTQMETLTPFADFLAKYAKDRSVTHRPRLISRTE